MSIHAFDDGYIRSQQHPQVGRRVAVLDPPSDFGSSPDTFSRGNVRLEPDTLYMTYFYPGDAADNFEIQLVDSAEWDAGAEPGLELVDQFPGYG